MPISVQKGDLVIYIYIGIYIHIHIYIFFFSYYLLSCSVPKDWIESPVLHGRTSLLMHSECNSLHLPTPVSFPPWSLAECDASVKAAGTCVLI